MFVCFSESMKRVAAFFVCVFCISFIISVPFAARADEIAPELPPALASFTLNGTEDNAVISSTTPSVAIAVSVPEEAYFTRVYICSFGVEPCNQGSATKFFSPNATTTEVSVVWSAEVSGGGFAPAGAYQILARFFLYDFSPDPFEEFAPFSITVTENEEEDDEEDVEDGKENDSMATTTPAAVSLFLNDAFENATISSSTPTVTITTSSSREVYFTRLYICPEEGDECGDGAYTKRFDINATSTSFTREWDGIASSSEPARAGAYRLLARYYDYPISPDALKATAFSTITIIVDEGEEDVPEPPAYTLITKDTFPTNRNVGDVVWNKAGSPYVVEGEVFLRHGSLTIEPGVVVKFKEQGVFIVHPANALAVNGTKEEPVTFTSFKDDIAGGDTNGDGSATVPMPGDWGYTSLGRGLSNDMVHIDYLKVRYGGGVALTNPQHFPDDPTPFVAPALHVAYSRFPHDQDENAGALEHLEVSYSAGVGLLATVSGGESTTITNSSFHDNATHGVYKILSGRTSKGHDDTGSLNLSGNWWGNASGPYHAVLNPEGEGDAIGVGAEDGAAQTPKLPALSSWLSSDPFSPPAPIRSDCCSSVVFLPGFQGSVLKTYGLLGTPDTLWPPTLSEVGRDLEQLAFEDGQPVTNNVVVDRILNNFLTVPVYQGFSDFMEDLVTIDDTTGTSTIRAWEPLAYDWRYGPDEIVGNPIHTSDGDIDLVQEIENLAANSYTGKVTLVAHSYGGLVGKSLIKKLAEEGKEDLIDTFIMVGTPQLGTPQTVAGLLHGDGSDFGPDADILGWQPFKLVTKKQARILGDTLTSAYALLPSPAYFQSVFDPVLFFNPGGPKSDEWRAVYDKDKGITTYNDMVLFLTAALVPRTGGILGMPKALGSSLIEKGKTVHDTYDSFGFPETLRVVQLAGWGLPTIKNITYSGGIAKTTHSVKFTTEGDKTVVYPSAIATDAEKYFLNLDIYNIDPTIGDFSHINLLSLPPTQDTLISIFMDIPVRTSIFVTSEKPEEEDVENKLIVSAHSPVTLGVTDQFGNYTGITPGQDPDADILTITTDIPGSSYFTVGDAKYLILPDDGKYTFVMGGTGEGEVTVIIETLSGDNQTTTATYNFSVSESSQATLIIENSTLSTIALDQDGDGNTDDEVLSDEVQAAQEEQQENNESETSAATTPALSGGGGGPLWNASPALSPVVLGVSTTAEATTSTIFTKNELGESIEEEVIAIIQQQQHIKNNEAITNETASTSMTFTASEQQASAIQSGWYDDFIGFIKNLLKKSISFFNSLF